MRAQDASLRQLLDDLAQEERTHEDRGQELTEEKLPPQKSKKMKIRLGDDFSFCRPYNQALRD